MKTKQAKLVYFLGAGAAKPCGYLTTPELYGSLVNEHGDLTIFKEFGDPLQEAVKGQPIDIEVLYRLVSQNVGDITNDMHDRLDPQSLGQQLIWEMLRRHPEWGDSLAALSNAFKECRDAIIDFIREKFWTVPPNCEPYESLRIVEAVRSLGHENVAIFTTNYDTSLEDFLQDRVLYTRGLVGGTYDPDVLVRESTEGVRLVQLHGSIDLYRLEDGRIVRINSFQRPGPWRGSKIEGPYLVPPAMDEIAYDDNQAKLLRLLRSFVQEAGAIVIIGFSFRDLEIVKILREAPPECTIFIACGKQTDSYLEQHFPNKGRVAGTPEYFPAPFITNWLLKETMDLEKEIRK